MGPSSTKKIEDAGEVMPGKGVDAIREPHPPWSAS
jgi:hypothetical protein